jgi:hypothetical protein
MTPRNLSAGHYLYTYVWLGKLAGRQLQTLLQHRSPARFRGLFAVLLLLMGTACSSQAAGTTHVAAVPPASSAARLPVVLIYGDSLTVLSEADAREFASGKYRLAFRAAGGTSPCDWTGHAATDRSEIRPDRVVIAFTGNSGSCERHALQSGGLRAVVADYRRDLYTLGQVFAGIPITLVTTPAMSTQAPGSWYPINGNAAFNRMYGRVATALGWRLSEAADQALTPGHVFVWRRPAFPGNGPETVVRAPDGVHVLPAGAWYFAAALVDAAGTGCGSSNRVGC